MRRRLWIGAFVFAGLLAFPRTGNAGIGEIILELSGPRMAGVGYECRLMFDGKWESCKIAGAMGIAARNVPRDKAWLALGANYYWSVKATVNGQQYDWWDVQMLAFDPMLEIESKSWERCTGEKNLRTCDDTKIKWQIYHGVLGLSYNRFWGRGFSAFSNVGFKLRPVGIIIPVSDKIGIDLSYDLRLYPDRFTADDFGRIPVVSEGNGAEAVHALVFGVRIKR